MTNIPNGILNESEILKVIAACNLTDASFKEAAITLFTVVAQAQFDSCEFYRKAELSQLLQQLEALLITHSTSEYRISRDRFYELWQSYLGE